MFVEIVDLYDWILKEFGDVVEFSRLWDGYKITFPNGADIVQHSGSYESKMGCVEPAGNALCLLSYHHSKSKENN